MLSQLIARFFPISFLFLILSSYSARAIVFVADEKKYKTELFCEALLDPHIALANLLPEVSDDQALLLMKANYSELMTWLTQKADATAEGSGTAPKGAYGPNKDQTPSQLLFGKQIIEVDRTAVGFLAIKWLLANDYEAFTKNQPPPVKLSKESFAELRAYVKSVLKTPQDLDAMIVMLLTNDLGKVKRYHDITEKAVGRAIVDHDQVLFAGFTEAVELSPNFMRLPQLQKDWITDGLLMGSGLNVGQFAQAENLPASLNAVKVLAGKPEAFDFKFIELLLDVAGAQGHMDSGGAKVMIEPVYRNFVLARKALLEVIEGKSVREAYDQILIEKNKLLVSKGMTSLDVNKKQDRALLRLLTLSRTTSLEQAEELQAVFHALPVNAKEILISELNVNATDDGWGILPYYGPAFIVNAIGSLSKTPHGSKEAFRTVLLSLARVFQEGRILLKGREGSDVLTINIEQLAKYTLSDAYKADPNSLLNQEYELYRHGEDDNQYGVKLAPLSIIDTTKLNKMKNLKAYRGKRVLVVGIGGGSDAVQAALFAQMLKAEGAQIRGVVSVRTTKTGSQGATGQQGEQREYKNVEEVRPNVLKVNPTSTGTGRTLEPLISSAFPETYIILDNGSFHALSDSLIQVLALFGAKLEHANKDCEVDAVILVDTGGDSLYKMSTAVDGQSSSKTTPDQDLRVLQSVHSLIRLNYPIEFTTAVMAAGVDTPPYAQQVLEAAQATYYSLTAQQALNVQQQYVAWEMDGTNDARYGKTPLAWQAALRGEAGVTVVPLPTRVVLDHANPWNPFLRVPLQGIVLMKLEDHIKAIQ